MIAAIVFLMIVSIIIVLVFSKPRKAVFPVLIYVNLIIILAMLYVYFIKTGGFSLEQKNILFGLKYIFKTIFNIPISFNSLSSVLIVARLSFVFFFMCNAISHSYAFKKFFAKHFYLYGLILLPIVVAIFITLPENYSKAFSFRYSAQDFVCASVDALIYLYLLASIVIYIFEYYDIKLSFAKQHHANIMFSMFSLILPFVFFAAFEPVSIFQNYSSIKVDSPFLSLSRQKSIVTWGIVLSLCILSTIVTLMQIWKYYKYDYDRTKQEMTISQKVASATITSSVLIHGLKNQLLASGILCKRMQTEINGIEDVEKKEKLLSLNQKLSFTNEFMLSRFENLYKSFLNVKIVLVKVKIFELIEIVKSKVSQKISNVEIDYSFEKGCLFADKELLSEAIYNVIINALDAVEDVKNPKVKVELFFSRSRTIIKISDNGKGIDKKFQKKIFTPFSTSKNTNTNWGLGLCYASQIVKKHMGDIRFESTFGKGTVFYIMLPRYVEEEKK